MKIRFYIILLISTFLSVFNQSFAQKIDIETLSFKTEFEKRVFKNHNEASFLELLLAISPEMNDEKAKSIELKIKSFEEELKLKKFETKKEAKKIKMIFDLTHDSFLEKYEDIVNFEKIFSEKIFNCVSGSSLYALILQSFNIPYVIKESPTHVYIVVNPDHAHIVLESTLPNIGFIDKSDHYVKGIVDELVTLKQIKKEEVENNGYRKVYNAFFFSEETIPLKALASIQYSNEAIGLIEEEKYKEALNSIYKAQVLYESKTNNYIITTLLSNLTYKNQLNTIKDFSYVTAYSNHVDIDDDYIEAIFKEKLYKKIYNEGDLKFAEVMTNYFVKHIEDSLLTKNIALSYYLQMAGYHQAKSNWEKSIELAEKAYFLNPKNVQLESIISISINNKNVGKTITSKTLQELKEYVNRFDFLKENSMIINMMMKQSTYLAINALANNNITESLDAIKTTEELITSHKGKVNYDEDMLSKYYKILCEYYFQKNQYSKGSNAIKSGLKIMPNNKILNDKKDILKRAGYY